MILNTAMSSTWGFPDASSCSPVVQTVGDKQDKKEEGECLCCDTSQCVILDDVIIFQIII